MSLQAAMFRARAGKFETPVPASSMLAIPSAEYCRELEERCEQLEKRINELVAPPKHISFDLIRKLTCKAFHVTHEDVMGTSRLGFISLARQTICYLTKTYIPTMSFPWIGKQLDRDHTTVLHAWQKIGNRRLKEPELDARISGIEQQLHKAVQP